MSFSNDCNLAFSDKTSVEEVISISLKPESPPFNTCSVLNGAILFS